MTNVSALTGQTLECIIINPDEIWFKTQTSWYQMYHSNQCCEQVDIEDVTGDWNDLIGSPLLLALEVANDEYESAHKTEGRSETWTFYKLATIKGYVDIRWYGTSSGYYSESVDFREHPTPMPKITKIKNVYASFVSSLQEIWKVANTAFIPAFTDDNTTHLVYGDTTICNKKLTKKLLQPKETTTNEYQIYPCEKCFAHHSCGHTAVYGELDYDEI